MSYKILLVDDDKENLHINKALLTQAGYQVSISASGDEAIRSVKTAKQDFALILMDYHMPGLNGAQTVEAIKKIKSHQQILAFSMDDTREVMRETFKAGVLDFLDKNSDNDVFLSTVANFCEKYGRLYKTIDKLDFEPDEKEKCIASLGMIGRSESLYELCQQIKRIGPTQATTLIVGESGTGKELVAKALHDVSNRRSGSYVAFNIAAETPSLLDSSLFGHRKGAFTGAVQDQKGKFRSAEGGTIFLDEIGDLTLDLQVKLLRVLQEKEVTPVGANHPVAVNIRIIAATHKDLKKMVANGTFREDLYYRLSNIVIETTPLRQRPDDIEPLVAAFTDEICKENSFYKRFQKRCLEIFKHYPWKGNVRELRSTVERHLIKNDKELILESDLDAALFEKTTYEAPVTLEEIDEHAENVKKQMVVKILKESISRAEASRKLGVTQNRLHYFLVKWGLDKGADT
jgi:DNA-binding NtrC family response regulator